MSAPSESQLAPSQWVSVALNFDLAKRPMIPPAPRPATPAAPRTIANVRPRDAVESEVDELLVGGLEPLVVATSAARASLASRGISTLRVTPWPKSIACCHGFRPTAVTVRVCEPGSTGRSGPHCTRPVG